jgi:hypothetical protein
VKPGTAVGTLDQRPAMLHARSAPPTRAGRNDEVAV